MREDRNFGGKLLLPELVPQQCFGLAPRNFIAPKAWDALRKFVYARAGYQCEICGKPTRMEAHERYLIEGDTMFLVRILAVCPACHLTIHFGFAKKQKKDEMALRHMMKVNKWDRNHCLKAISAAFIEWKERDHVVNVNFSMFNDNPEFSKIVGRLRQT